LVCRPNFDFLHQKTCQVFFEVFKGGVVTPKLLFDFVAFSHLFAQEVIPTQVATRRSLMLFNPARLITFGLT
jgi:hypothetical protein